MSDSQPGTVTRHLHPFDPPQPDRRRLVSVDAAAKPDRRRLVSVDAAAKPDRRRLVSVDAAAKPDRRRLVSVDAAAKPDRRRLVSVDAAAKVQLSLPDYISFLVDDLVAYLDLAGATNWVVLSPDRRRLVSVDAAAKVQLSLPDYISFLVDDLVAYLDLAGATNWVVLSPDRRRLVSVDAAAKPDRRRLVSVDAAAKVQLSLPDYISFLVDDLVAYLDLAGATNWVVLSPDRRRLVSVDAEAKPDRRRLVSVDAAAKVQLSLPDYISFLVDDLVGYLDLAGYTLSDSAATNWVVLSAPTVASPDQPVSTSGCLSLLGLNLGLSLFLLPWIRHRFLRRSTVTLQCPIHSRALLLGTCTPSILRSPTDVALFQWTLRQSPTDVALFQWTLRQRCN
ncbi:hypothetical protein VOLCADRAFT_93483 [Volvox carteri f. nagariensis]|uniref:Uncharacterized protein n=1 Tax=Volvox carteri f. nagariensis TaxID=3068 RepID=D8U285_VOLCA|nr:uncharacterized protein VOLCADRAFT_93483 [Volvox carteri f. nagariensis]EFJ46021.1 hypothetical protein VOLCADRAFT_93483 [Volvox carteri f. nagariensis]|eukprot:XP_002952771.1 hypothetical protein VOLCADRAFT_93483 [Volvox carteri f. nagariensis]